VYEIRRSDPAYAENVIRIILAGRAPDLRIQLDPKAQKLAVWGKNDPFFLPPGAEAFKRDNPNAEVHFYDTGHFALETHYREIADAIREFLNRKLATQASAA
jgi:pimeloyl-ACP methyl ester carboxylesterase